MNNTSYFIIVIFVMLVLGCVLFAGDSTTNKNQKGICLFMNSDEGKLVIMDPKNSRKGKIEKIVYNNTDLTLLLREKFDLESLTYASDRLLIFGGGKVVLQSDEWKCEQGTVFVPGKSEALIIKASAIAIRYHEEKGLLTGKNAEIKRISLLGKDQTEKKEIVLNLRIDLNAWE